MNLKIRWQNSEIHLNQSCKESSIVQEKIAKGASLNELVKCLSYDKKPKVL